MHSGSGAYNYFSSVAACVQAHLGEMAILLGYGGQSCQTAVISLNYGVLFHIINISFAIKSSFPNMVRDFSGTIYIYFLTTQGHGGPPQISDELNAGAASETTPTLKTIHIIHSHIHSNMADGWLWRPNDIRWSGGSKASWHLSYRWGKNLTQETCPDRGSNPGPLRNRSACYRLLIAVDYSNHELKIPVLNHSQIFHK